MPENNVIIGSNLTINGNVPNAPGGILLLDSEGKLPALDGSNLTGISTPEPTVSVEGEQIYTTPGNYSWVCPQDVTSVSVVCVGGGGGGVAYNGYWNGCGGGGGGLVWKNNIPVTPGHTYTIEVGIHGNSQDPRSGGQSTGLTGGTSSFDSLIFGYGGTGGSENTGGVGGSFSYDDIGGGGNGGNGGTKAGTYATGGGGASGYNGNGGNGSSSTNGYSGSGTGGGASGGSSIGSPYHFAGSGGGVGLFGQGTDGMSVVWDNNSSTGIPGNGGSGGGNGNQNPRYGSGGGGAGATAFSGYSGAVRIIWGPNRSFPNNAT